ncbi:uncharacterized protein OCT59_006416 [Rhizophagus irregularis]|uniref:uncharacterized protein n=1 Tax=Rhizophagus irregularis TaxID=588596 RepID=UPI0033189790|nr:hypothetical protein OCT59_006416 [Rhizophagus irregularis]
MGNTRKESKLPKYAFERLLSYETNKRDVMNLTISMKHYDHGLRKNLIIFPQYMRKFCMLTAFIFLDPAVPPR